MEEKPYLVKTHLKLIYSEFNEFNSDIFNKEFITLSEVEVDPIGHWVKLKKASGEIDDSIKILVDMLVELNRKVERLEISLNQNNKKVYASLNFSDEVLSIGFEHFQLKENSNLVVDNLYYGRLNLQTYPPREFPIFFKFLQNGLCHIERIHERDEKDWASYFRAKERIMIREGRK